MPFDLMRHDMLMTYAPIPPERVLAIVDDLFLPLVTPARPRQAPPRAHTEPEPEPGAGVTSRRS